MNSLRRLSTPLAGIGLLLLVNLLANPGFLRVSLLRGHLYGGPMDILVEGAPACVAALGMTLVIATGGIDLSVGSVMAIAGSAAALAVTVLHASLPVVLALSVGAGVAAGTLNGLLVAAAGIQPIVATLILMVAGRGVSELMTGGQIIAFSEPGTDFLGAGFFLGLPVTAFVVAGLFVLSHAALRRSAAGLFIEAVGDNPTASRFAGLASGRIRFLAYLFCGGCAGLAGLLSAANIRSADSLRAGENMELNAIFAVVVGGTALEGGRFLLLGSLAGAILLQTLTATMYNLGVPPAIAPVPKALVVIGVCVAQSERVRTWFGRLAASARTGRPRLAPGAAEQSR
jgi:simple sugar transport system permease protein